MNAERWARRLAELGHDAAIAGAWRDDPADVVIAGDADVAHAAPDVPWRIVVTHQSAAARIPAPLRERASVIHPSAEPVAATHPPDPDVFQVCVLAHLRAGKDPLRSAEAARLLPPASRVQVVHAGAAIGREMREEAQEEEGKNLRYRWLGDLPRSEALRLLARSRVLSAPAGANAIAEALAAGVPIVATRTDVAADLLGPDYPGLVAPRDAHALATALYRAETDPVFYETLRSACEEAKEIVDPAREREEWRALLAGL